MSRKAEKGGRRRGAHLRFSWIIFDKKERYRVRNSDCGAQR